MDVEVAVAEGVAAEGSAVREAGDKVVTEAVMAKEATAAVTTDTAAAATEADTITMAVGTAAMATTTTPDTVILLNIIRSLVDIGQISEFHRLSLSISSFRFY